ncbi:MAG TPA: hypothetical protein VFQ61_35460 [Polyangiaceae bacterium]|nr:hypothetical protein [Polyangiaceae bacterium]
MHRRMVLAALAQLPLLSITSGARAAEAPNQPRLKSIEQDQLGTTFYLGLPQAPFATQNYADDTVIVFVPRTYRFHAAEGVPAVVHFHGHNSSAKRAMVAHSLREQLVDSRQNAVLIVPQLAVFAADSSCGRLAQAGGLAKLLGSALTHAARFGRTALTESRFPDQAKLGRVCISAHSGGYHAAACSLRSGGVDVSETYLFDALYAESQTFRDWVLERPFEPESRHKLVSYFTAGAATEPLNHGLRADLERRGVWVAQEQREGELSRRALSHAGAVFVRTSVGHSAVTWETNALRDVLHASMLPRHLNSKWFAQRDGARPLERRR